MKKYIITIFIIFIIYNITYGNKSFAGTQYFRDNAVYADSNGNMGLNSISAGDSTVNITDDVTVDSDEQFTATKLDLGANIRTLNSYISISAAMSDTANWDELWVTEAYICPNGTYTIPLDDKIKFLKSGILTPNKPYPTVSLVVYGQLEAGRHQIFDPNAASGGDSGNWVTFGTRAVSEIYPEWWRIDNSADQVGILKAIGACYVGEPGYGTYSTQIITFQAGKKYALSDTVTVNKNNLLLLGYGAVFEYTKASGSAFYFDETWFSGMKGGQIILIQDSNDVCGITCEDTRRGIFQDIDIMSDNGVTYAYYNVGLNLIGSVGKNVSLCKFDHFYFQHTGWAIKASGPPITSNRFNDFVIRSRNGLNLSGVSGNKFEIDLECDTNQICLTDSSINNKFSIIWYEPVGLTSPDFFSDTTSKGNIFDIMYEDDYFVTIGGQNITRRYLDGRLVEDGYGEDPVGLGYSTNRNWLATESETFNTWTAVNCTVTANSTIAPDGSMTADTITQIVLNGVIYKVKVATSDDLSGKVWTGSVWLKADSDQKAQISIYNEIANDGNQYNLTANITQDWKRYYVFGVYGGGNTSTALQIRPSEVDSGRLGTIYAWGAKLEQGYLSDYISLGIRGSTGGISINTHESIASITASASITIGATIPNNCVILGCQIRVDEALAVGETWNALYSGGASQAIATAQAVAKNTSVNKFFNVNAATNITTDTTYIEIQRSSNPGVDVFTAQGKIRAIVYYQKLGNISSL